MKKAFLDYQYLAGSHGNKGSIWQGPDHFLIVEGHGFMLPFRESYRRIDYQNVQMLTVTQTGAWHWITVALLIPVLLFGTLAFFLSDEEPTPATVFGIAAAGLLAILITHLVKGASCRSSLQTAVQSLRLKPLKRMKQANRVIQQMEQICLQHQTKYPSLDALLAAQGGATDAANLSATPPAHLPIANRPSWAGAWQVVAAGVSLLLAGPAIAAELYVDGTAYLVLDIMLQLAAFCFAIMGLVQAMRKQGPTAVKASLIIAMVGQVVLALVIYMCMIIFMTQQQLTPSEMQATWSLAHFGDIGAGDLDSSGLYVSWIAAAAGVALAILGAILIPLGQVRKALIPAVAAPPLPPPPQSANGDLKSQINKYSNTVE